MAVLGLALAGLVLGLGGLACLGAGVVGGLAYWVEATEDVQQRMEALEEQDRAVQRELSLLRAPGYDVDLQGDEPMLGPSDAPHRVVVYSDYGCPHCATAFEGLSTLADAGRVQVRYRTYPLSAACNVNVAVKTDDARCESIR